MRIIGFNLTKISIERKDKLEGKLEIKQSIDIDNISKDKINITEGEVLKVNFTFSINYSPDFAKLEFKGGLIIMPEADELKKVLKDWEKKQISDNFKIPLFNFIMNKCNIKAVTLEDEMALPIHIQLPRLNPKPN